MRKLPIYDVRDEIVGALRDGGLVIVDAPTGSGKSTQVPQMVLDAGLAGDGMIVVLQPRRLAARMLARRVAGERGGRLGGEVGYQVRFDNCSGRGTRIKFETDGIILRELQRNAGLPGVSVVVFDEFHERHLYSDLMLGLVRELRAGLRPDLKVVVMSATLDSDVLLDYFGDVPVVRAGGRTFAVDIRYIRPDARLRKLAVWDLAARELRGVLREQVDGDVLVFMPGVYEIRRTIECLRRLSEVRGALVLPLHGGLPPDEQDRALAPSRQRKIIVATNVAETSLTIDGVTVVVDSGLVRQSGFDVRRGISTLLIEKCSRASADQRAGRAGRVSEGICLRLWSEREHGLRELHTLPELLRVDLSATVLQLESMGVSVGSFGWITAPRERSLEWARELLAGLGALDAAGGVTEVGRRLAAFPLHPRIARMLLAAEYYGCVPTMCLVAALLQERGIMLRKCSGEVRGRRLDLLEDDSDVILMIRAWEAAADHGFDAGFCGSIGVHGQAARKAGVLRRQLEQIAQGQGLDCFEAKPTVDSIGRSLLAGFSDHVAQRSGGGRCVMVGGRRGGLDSDTVLGGECDLFVALDVSEIGCGRGEVEVRLSGLSGIRREWLAELFGEEFAEKRVVYFDVRSKRVLAERQVVFRDLIIESGRVSDVSDDEAASVLAGEVVSGRIVLKNWNGRVEQWISRVNMVAENCPELGVPGIGDEDRGYLLEQICHGARGAKELKSREVWGVLQAWLSFEQREAVKLYAPERVLIENGRNPRVHYDDASGPYIALRVQELYDTHQTPLICDGRVRVKVRVLAPSQRPVQITDDLEGFWQNSYPQIKKDLRGRYPKHEWR